MPRKAPDDVIIIVPSSFERMPGRRDALRRLRVGEGRGIEGERRVVAFAVPESLQILALLEVGKGEGAIHVRSDRARRTRLIFIARAKGSTLPLSKSFYRLKGRLPFALRRQDRRPLEGGAACLGSRAVGLEELSRIRRRFGGAAAGAAAGAATGGTAASWASAGAPERMMATAVAEAKAESRFMITPRESRDSGLLSCLTVSADSLGSQGYPVLRIGFNVSDSVGPSVSRAIALACRRSFRSGILDPE